MTTTTVQAPNPSEHPDLYDTIVFRGAPSPGVVVVRGAERLFDWKKKKAKGSSGANLNYDGSPTPSFSFVFTLWHDHETDVNHLDEWAHRFLPVLITSVPDNKTPEASDVYHPHLAAIGISSIVVEKIGQLEAQGRGRWTVEVKCTPYAPPVKTKGKSKPKGSQDPYAFLSDGDLLKNNPEEFARKAVELAEAQAAAAVKGNTL